jgi:hypothetical protein
VQPRQPTIPLAIGCVPDFSRPPDQNYIRVTILAELRQPARDGSIQVPDETLSERLPVAGHA